MKAKILKHAIIIWILFSALYWISAHFKPFHVDEFYSWVYSQRCSFGEILKLKDFGIGHPPLYHLLQKLVQTIIPSYHPLHVRLVNYLVGSLFVFLLTNTFLRFNYQPFFCYSACLSAMVLNGFVFSRMWGLVGLFSLLLLWAGERYFTTRKATYFLIFLGVCGFGFFSDYNYFLLVPYIIIIFLSLKTHSNKPQKIILALTGISWITATLFQALLQGKIFSFFYMSFRDFTKIFYVMTTLVFDFAFVELTMLALVIIIGYQVFQIRSTNNTGVKNNLTGPAFLMLAFILTGTEVIIKLRIVTSLIAALIMVAVIIILIQKKRLDYVRMNRQQARILSAILGAFFILLAVSKYFWRDLRFHKYIFILAPFFLFLILITQDKKTINIISWALLFSGIIFIFSNRIANFYPPPSFPQDKPVLYQSEFSYSSQYLCSEKQKGEKPMFINLKTFTEFCRVCRLGVPFNPRWFDNLDRFFVVCHRDFDLSPYLPANAILIKQLLNYSWLDRVLLSFLKPVYYEWVFSVSEYQIKKEISPI